MRSHKNLDSSTPEDSAAGSGPISRRTVVKAAAWSLPVIAVAVAAPAAAASIASFIASFGLGGTSTGSGTYSNGTLNNSIMYLTDQGSEPSSTGVITATVRLPNPDIGPAVYVAHFGNSAAGAALDTSSGIHTSPSPWTEWTYVYNGIVSGFPTFTFMHPGLTATNTTVSTSFPNVWFEGAGATTSNQFKVSGTSANFASLTSSFWPG